MASVIEIWKMPDLTVTEPGLTVLAGLNMQS